MEDYRFINFVEMFNLGFGNMTAEGSPCAPWTWLNGFEPWLNCEPAFLSDNWPNGYVTASSYSPAYVGDDQDRLRTAKLDLSEMTEATLTYDMSAVEIIFGRVVLYKNNAPYTVLRFYNGIPTTPPACGLVFHETVDLTPFCDDGFDDVFVAFRGLPTTTPCGDPLPGLPGLDPGQRGGLGPGQDRAGGRRAYRDPDGHDGDGDYLERTGG